MQPDQKESTTDATPDPGRWRILAVLLTAQFMSLVGISVVNVVLPSVQTGIDATPADLQWVLSGYALTFGIVLVAAGRAGDILGRGILFAAGVAVFTLASVAAGLAVEPSGLVIARFVQGVGSGLVIPQVMGMIQQHFHGRELGTAYGLFGTVSGVSVAVGPLLGGCAVALFGAESGWRWTFLVNLPLGLATLALAVAWFPRPWRTATERRGAGTRRDLDPVGCVLLGLSILTLLLPFTNGRDDHRVWWLLPVSGALFTAWVRWERGYLRRGRAPMVDLALFRIPSFTLGTVIGGLYYFGTTSVWVVVAMYVQQGAGFSALEAGLLGLPSALCAAFVSHWAGSRVAGYGRRIVIAGAVVALGGLGASIGVVLAHTTGVGPWWLLATLSLLGVAQGAIISPNQTLTMMDVPVGQSGSAGGLVQTSQRVGTSVGIALITAIFFAVRQRASWDAALAASFAAIGVVVLATLVVAIVDQRKRSARD